MVRILKKMKTQSLVKRTGIWLDTKQAKIISISSTDHSIETIPSGIETRERIQGEKGKQGRMGDQFIVSEKKRQSKIEEQEKVYCKSIIEEIKKVKSLVIFGPADMKYTLAKEIKNNSSFSPNINGIETADTMTEKQMVAWVRDFYDA